MSTSSHTLDDWLSTADIDGDAARLKRQAIIRARLADLIEADPLDVAITLGNLALAIFAQRFPAQPSEAEKGLIQENYPQATDDLIAERAMNEEGLIYAVTSFNQLARICIDYSPESNTKAAVGLDTTTGPHVAPGLQKSLDALFAETVKAGMSPFGVGTMMILSGMVLAVRQGVTWPAITRTLLESVEHAQGIAMRTRKPSAEDIAQAEENALQVVMAQMGISRTTARKYLAAAKQMMAENTK